MWRMTCEYVFVCSYLIALMYNIVMEQKYILFSSIALSFSNQYLLKSCWSSSIKRKTFRNNPHKLSPKLKVIKIYSFCAYDKSISISQNLFSLSGDNKHSSQINNETKDNHHLSTQKYHFKMVPSTRTEVVDRDPSLRHQCFYLYLSEGYDAAVQFALIYGCMEQQSDLIW